VQALAATSASKWGAQSWLRPAREIQLRPELQSDPRLSYPAIEHGDPGFVLDFEILDECAHCRIVDGLRPPMTEFVPAPVKVCEKVSNWRMPLRTQIVKTAKRDPARAHHPRKLNNDF
jgi:hypothetical protein